MIRSWAAGIDHAVLNERQREQGCHTHPCSGLCDAPQITDQDQPFVLEMIAHLKKNVLLDQTLQQLQQCSLQLMVSSAVIMCVLSFTNPMKDLQSKLDGAQHSQAASVHVPSPAPLLVPSVALVLGGLVAGLLLSRMLPRLR